MPACTLACFGSGRLFASIKKPAQDPAQKAAHKFLQEMDRKLTYLQFFRERFKKYIRIMKSLENYLGKEKLWELLRRASWEENVELGKRLSSRVTSLEFFSYAFRNPNGMFPHTMSYEIIGDTEHAFEVRITECLTEVVFREAGALEIGHASVCHADFALPEGLSIHPPIKLIRNKTLMEGHDCCNHRYVWDG